MLNNKLLPFLKPQYEKKDAELAFLKRMKGEVLPRPMYGECHKIFTTNNITTTL